MQFYMVYVCLLRIVFDLTCLFSCLCSRLVVVAALRICCFGALLLRFWCMLIAYCLGWIVCALIA